MKRKKMILMLGALVLAATMIGYAVAQERNALQPPSASTPRRAGDRRPLHPGPMLEPGGMPGPGMPGGEVHEVHRRLRQRIPAMNVSGVKFVDAIEYLRDVSKTNIFVKWEMLKKVGVKKTEPINVKLTNVTFAKALKVILEDAGGVNPLGFAVDENVITISTREDLDRDKRMAMQEKVMAAEAAFPRRRAERMEQMIGLVQRMKQTCFDSQAVGVMAVGALKDDIPRKPEEVIIDLESQLSKTKTLGLRNAIRLSLKDIYKLQGKNVMVLQHLRAMLAENDKAIQAEEKK